MRDPQLERLLDTDGYVVVDFATPEQLADLRSIYEAHDSGITSGYYPSIMSDRLAYKAQVHEAITEVLWPPFESYLIDHVPLVGAFMVKHPGPGTEVSPHMDWNIVDESTFRSVNCWVPTQPITPEIGFMRFLPGSHRYLEALRGSPGIPAPWRSIHERVEKELMVEVPISEGQGLIYDNRVLHATPVNTSDVTRVVAYINAIPAAARPLHYHLDPSGTVRGRWVEPEFFHTFRIGDTPAGEVFSVEEGRENPVLTFEELARLHNASR